jgi:hypothetical protein
MCKPLNYMVRVPKHLQWFANDWKAHLSQVSDVEAVLGCLRQFTSEARHSSIAQV